MYTESKEKRRCLNEMTDRHTYVSKHQNSDALRKFKEKPYQLKNKEKIKMIECMKKIARKQNMVGDEKVTVCTSSNERDMCKKRDTELMKEKEKK